ncbi:hypothetical protein N7492_003598 [Penicillium capsulatum]|uniref:Autophagy-related protein 14 n=1 Tax=Penicillium capsulatum TaxID=69766 RepID=A0A9W9IJQ5_9EURO|nr:hypothetical protein N7492_003598 [Penicillium capsulatum]KAJ6121819.1 hypothetical protein N7512_004284 [Penicillium capsulatum]
MSCHICATSNSRQLFLCPTCARNRLYQIRLENAQILLEKETVGRHIEAAVSQGGSRGQPPSVERRSSGRHQERLDGWTLSTVSSKKSGSVHRRNDTLQRIEVLKEEIKAQKIGIAARREVLARRRSDAESAQYQVEEREAANLTSIQNTHKRTEHLWHSLHSKTAEARIFLCREAAHLYGLRQKSTKKSDTRQTYVLGGISIIDLRDMNGVTPELISASLSNVARLLVLVSHYLSLRLPAEIVLPNANCGGTTIYTPAASYQSHEAYEATVIPQSSRPNPTTSKTAEPRTQSRPRPLYIDTPLYQLAKEDTGTYAFFLEGATLLAWDVAWLCRTQGINLASDSWEDTCNIGKNMWQLLVAPPAQTSTLMRVFAGRDTQAKVKSSKDNPQTTIQRTKSFPMMGHYSHGTAHSFLSSAEGTEFMRSWKLPSSTRITDKLKANLLGEMASAEWELLEENEWDDGNAESQPPSVTPEPNAPTLTGPKPRSSAPSTLGADDRRPRGTSGWTKLNSR